MQVLQPRSVKLGHFQPVAETVLQRLVACDDIIQLLGYDVKVVEVIANTQGTTESVPYMHTVKRERASWEDVRDYILQGRNLTGAHHFQVATVSEIMLLEPAIARALLDFLLAAQYLAHI
jgi:hypothetical protein